ncbi:tyrosine-type recombinase/integrase [Nonomuraea sp. NPDC000554]|uniref:tyrosine-type recombinase/integrase n=1 Tax=Nonomuraea sp. NPDC000554 TaxID=3154259 RepID=UPI0033322CAE
MSDDNEYDLEAIRLPDWGRVVPTAHAVPYDVLDPEGQPVEPIRRYLRDFVARGQKAGSVRSYAYVLLRWWRWLHAIGVAWEKATSAEVREYVLWLQRAPKPTKATRTTSAATAGTINPITRKHYPSDQYAPRTVRHSNAVLRSFYEFWIERGEGPLVNPVPQERPRGQRPNAHHNPLEPFRPEGRLRYNPPVPKRRPRAMPDQQWDDLFTAFRSDRDRAIVTIMISSGIRAGELLGITSPDVDWGDQLVRVRRKGTGAEQWLPVSAEAFIWLRLYLDQLRGCDLSRTIWWTLRRRSPGTPPLHYRPLTYDALRAVLRRVNESLGTNWTMHDFRHTCALRMLRSNDLSLRDIQVVLGHAHLTTTQLYLEEEPEVVIRRVHEYLSTRQQTAQPPQTAASPAIGYNATDLDILFGRDAR